MRSGRRTSCLVLYPGKGANGQATKHGWDPRKLNDQLGQEAAKRGIPDDDSVVEGITAEPHAPPGRANGSIGAQESSGR